MDVAGEEADMVNKRSLRKRVRLDDERACLGNKGQKLGSLHPYDLGVGKVPDLIEAVDEEVGTFIRAFDACEDRKADLTADGERLFIVGEVEVDLLLVRAREVEIEVPVNEMVGDEYACISDLLIILKVFSHPCPCTAADGIGVQVRFVQIGL